MEIGFEETLQMLTPGYLAIAAVFLFLAYTLISVILVYHWRHFTTNAARAKAIMWLYFGVSVLLLFALFASLAVYTAS